MSKFNRRKLLEAAPCLLACRSVSLIQGSSSTPTGDPSPEIQLDASINFNDPQIFSFIFDDALLTFEGKPILSDYDQKNFKVILDVSFLVGTKDQDLIAAKREYYAVKEDHKEVGEVSVVVIYKQPVTLSITSLLLVARSATIDLEKKIIALFKDYKPPEDPIKYATRVMGSDGISTDMFAVRAAFSLKKKTKTPIEENATQRTRLFDMYSGNGQVSGVVYGIGPSNEPVALSRYLKDKNITLNPHPVRTETLTQIPEHKLDPLHQKELKKPQPPQQLSEQDREQAVDDIVDSYSGGIDPTECHLQASKKRKIATVFAWPEFMIEWVPFRVKIGCITLTLWLPRVHIRESDLVLYATLRHEPSLGQAFVDMTIGCMVTAALTAIVVGVLANFAAAMATYLALFNSCVTNQIACLVPNLVVVVESGDWS